MRLGKEKTMITAEDILKEKPRDIVSIAWDQTVQQACQRMVEKKIGAILVDKDGQYIGIWTERDLLHKITEEGFNPQTAIISDHMSAPLKTAPHSTRIHKLEEMFLGLFLRHLPIEKDAQIIGLLSIGDVLRASLIDMDRQLKELNAFVTWDYYENWREGRTKPA
jgi:signal-transduction protein with cAMP-binding, CBS, and nucleotidyltransferase domain